MIAWAISRSAALSFLFGLSFLSGAPLFGAPSATRPQETVSPYGDLAAFLRYFEPERAANLGLGGFAERVDDLSEEGLAGRALGYRDFRARLSFSGADLFPNAPGDLAPILDADRFLARRIANFSSVRSQARSPLYYIRAVSRALVHVELNPALGESERRRALTVRARQLPHALESARSAVVNPPAILTRQAIQEGRETENWIGTLLVRYAALPESGEKWALDQALSDLRAALNGYVNELDTDILPLSRGREGLGEESVSAIARTFGFDGVYHALETLGRAVQETTADLDQRLAAMGMDRRAVQAPGQPLRPVDIPLFTWELSRQWPEEVDPRIGVDFGPPLSGFPGALATVWPGVGRSSAHSVRLYAVRNGSISREGILELAVAQAWGYHGLARGLSPVREGDDVGNIRLLMAWDGLSGPVGWFTLATRHRYSSDGPPAFGAGNHAANQAVLEAEAARSAAGVHLGETTADEAVARLATIAGIPREGARRLLTGHLSDPADIFAPAVGFVLYEIWRRRGEPDPMGFFAELLKR